MKASTRDRLGSLLLLLFVVSLWVQRNYLTPFGGIFPDFVMVTLALILLVTLGLSFTSRATMKDSGPVGGAAPAVSWKDMVVVGAILFAWAVLLRFLGFVLCGVAGFAAISWYLATARRDLKVIFRSVAVAALVTGVLVAVFGWILQVPLPPGALFE